jgi:dienelactone hydrolase
MAHARVSRRGLMAGIGAMAAAGDVGGGAAEAECPVRGDDYRATLLQCLGGDWPPGGPLEPRVESAVQKDGYRLERISYLVEPHERLAAYLLIPDGVTESSRRPGICVWHQHNGAYDVGKDEAAGLRLEPMHHTGVALAREGYVVLCPDAAGFGERNRRGSLNGRNLEHYLFAMYVSEGKSLAWKNILDMRRAVDLLAARPEVDADRLGCYGHSMGSTHTWSVGPWEPRLKALVGNCCMPTYAAMERTDLIHCFPNYVPGWRRHGDIPDIVGMIAPRALHLNFGETDSGSPIEEVRSGLEVIRRAYRAKNAEDRFTHYVEAGSGHILSEEMFRRVKDHFARHLNGATTG